MENGKPCPHTIKKSTVQVTTYVTFFNVWLPEWTWKTWKTCPLSQNVCTENESWGTVKTLHRNSHGSVLRVNRNVLLLVLLFCSFCSFCSFLAFCLATHSCFRGGPESLCSGITLNVQSKSEWIRVIQRHKVQSEIFRDFSEILQRLRKHARQFPWKSSISVGKWNSVTRITHLEGTERKISPKSYRIRFKEIPMATIHGQNDPVVLPCCFSLDKDQTYPRFFGGEKSWGPKPNQKDTVHTPAVTGSRQDHDGISAENTLERPYLVYESFDSR